MLKTPIIDKLTKQNLLLGDFVLDEKSYCGVLYWCNYYNRYFTKTLSGGNIYSRTYTKIKKLKQNNIDTISTECRSTPLKKRW